jgi:hypothetical protein
MKRKNLPVIFVLATTLFANARSLSAAAAEELRWIDAGTLTLEGKGWTNTKGFYDRLPAKAEKMVRPPVWSLSHDSAGMCVRFITDATSISARWTLRKESLSMPHMPSSGVSGLDLYVKDDGHWRWAGAGRPKQFPTNEAVLLKIETAAQREFALYLPLYNGVDSVEIGVPTQAKLEKAGSRKLDKLIVFYGTSILHGGCASRPGMAYPAMLGRRLDCPTINLGFSGNAHSEPEVAQLLAELDPAIYVLDPLPNMDADGVRERMEPFVKTLRQAHPKTPIVLVETLEYTDAHLVKTRRERVDTSNAALREVYERLKKSGEKNLTYITSENLIGMDGEGTVDGTHPNDLGFARMADKIEPVLRKLLKDAVR